MHTRIVFAFAALLIGAVPAAAQSVVRPAAVDLPLLELPYNLTGGFRAPGMQQSLGVTAGVYEAGHTLLARVAPRHPRLRNAGITLVDYFTLAVPLGDAWLHEEWHRAVLGRNRIGSRNDVWNLKNIFAEAISVSHVKDEDLVRLKRDRPQDFVRMKAAGYEGEGELITRLERDQFFSESKAWHVGLYWLIALNDQLYVGSIVGRADSAEIDSLTNKANFDERTESERDASGHDFTAWVYHLFRQDEPFEARGVHPSGVGLDRYIKVSDLSAEEKRYVERQGKLAWLNFVDPNFIGVRGVSFRNPVNGRPARANLWMRHALTSFGHTVDSHLVYSQGALRLHAIAQRFSNHERSFPGLRVELLDVPLRVGSRAYLLSPRVGVWSQPRDGAFRTRDGASGGLLGIRVGTHASSPLQVYADAEIKSAGWVAGRPSLGRSATMQVGLRYSLQGLAPTSPTH